MTLTDEEKVLALVPVNMSRKVGALPEAREVRCKNSARAAAEWRSIARTVAVMRRCG